MNLSEAVQDFLAQKRIAVVGLSRRQKHVSHFVLNKLRSADRELIPVNPAATEIDGVRCYPDLHSIPGGVTAALVVTPASAAADVVRDCAAAGVSRVWLHRSFGPGSTSAEAVRVAREAKLTLIPAGCPLMFCAPVDPVHKCFRWCLHAIGRLPKTIGDAAPRAAG